MYKSFQLLFDDRLNNKMVLDGDLISFYFLVAILLIFFVFHIFRIKYNKIDIKTDNIKILFNNFTKPLIGIYILMGVLFRVYYMNSIVQATNFTDTEAIIGLFNLVFSIGRLIILIYAIKILSFIFKWILIFLNNKILHNGGVAT